MGHKVHPTAHRLQILYPWNSRWYSSKADYAKNTQQDICMREYLMKKYADANIDSIAIERGRKNLTVKILAAKPGFIIGRGGKGLDDLRKHLERKYLQMSLKVKLQIKELRSPALSASVVAQTISRDIQRRVRFRRVMKQTRERVMKAGAKGVKITLAGRLNGVEIARTETLFAGKVPLITFRSDVDYSTATAPTTYGSIGIKVWIYHGEVFGRKDKFSQADEKDPKGSSRSNRTPRSRSRRTNTDKA